VGLTEVPEQDRWFCPECSRRSGREDSVVVTEDSAMGTDEDEYEDGKYVTMDEAKYALSSAGDYVEGPFTACYASMAELNGK
jgi:hypothetical protein